MRVVVAPDSFKGTLTAVAAAAAVASGWRVARPRDEVVELPLSDGGDGMLEVVAAAVGAAERRVTEVADPLGCPRTARWLLLADGTAVVESAEACGLHLVTPGARSPMVTTTYGVGQLLEDARDAGAERVLVGLGGSATVDGGSGAMIGLGLRVSVDDGSGLKVGARDLHRAARITRGWAADWSGIRVELLADVRSTLFEAPAAFGPQKGATPDDVRALEHALRVWAEVVERDLDVQGLSAVPGTGAAGGLAFGLAAATGGRLVGGAGRVLELVGLLEAAEGADLVITGEGMLDASSSQGKVVGTLLERLGEGPPVVALVGRATTEVPSELRDRLDDLVEAPGDDPATAAAALSAAASDLARRHG